MVHDTSVDEVINNSQDITIEPDVLEAPNKVIYAITNEDGHVTQLVSSVFASEEQLAIAKPIAYGNGDNFVHVGEYIINILGKELMDDDFCANFKLIEIAEDVGTTYSVVERTKEEKDEELANRPQPETPPTQDITEISKSVEQTAKAVESLEETTTLLTAAVVEVDEKVTIQSEDREDIKILMAAVVELSEEIAALKEKLGVTDAE